MSFITKGHQIYMSQPTDASSEHIEQTVDGSIIVYAGVPSGGEAVTDHVVGTLRPEGGFKGRLVG